MKTTVLTCQLLVLVNYILNVIALLCLAWLYPVFPLSIEQLITLLLDFKIDPNIQNYAAKGIGMVGLVAENLLSHPFIVFRRQCQVSV